MGTLTAIHIRATEPAKVAAVRTTYPAAFTEPRSEFYTIEKVGFEPPQADLARLSADLDTDVLWLAFQSAADAFEFHHWRAGRRLRSLVFGCRGAERTWERADGEPETWEWEAIFGPEQLARALRYADVGEATELRRIWAVGEIVLGGLMPSLDAREAARAAAEFYRLPGWS